LNPILKAEKIRKTFVRRGRAGVFSRILEEKVAVDDVSFTLHPGEILGILGQSGSGKTTLVRTVAKLIEPDGGHAWLRVADGEFDIFSMSKQDLRNRVRPFMRMIFQHPDAAMNPSYTVREIVGQAVSRNPNRKHTVPELLKMVFLESYYQGKYPHELSGGEKRRVSICRAIASDPLVVFADEAVSGVDVTIQWELLRLFRKLCDERNMAIVSISHDVHTTSRFCDRIAVMFGGRFVEIGSRQDVSRERSLHPYTQLLYHSSIQMDKPFSTDPAFQPEDRPRIHAEARCVYYSECPIDKKKSGRCRDESPELVPVDSGNSRHLIACHFPDQCKSLRKRRGSIRTGRKP
jgi:ABC-type glutathione transport system ATPase component